MKEVGKEDFNQKITAEKAQEMLKKGGMVVSIEEAKEMLCFLRKLANIVVLKYLEK